MCASLPAILIFDSAWFALQRVALRSVFAGSADEGAEADGLHDLSE